jgi:hypothetical protein
MPRIHAGTWSTKPVSPKTMESRPKTKATRARNDSARAPEKKTEVKEEPKEKTGRKKVSLFDTISLYD